MGCFKCQATADKAILFDVISREGVVKICNECYKKENFPLVKQGENVISQKSQAADRLSSISGQRKESANLLKQDVEIKRVIEENFKKTLSDVKPRDDLVDNFHWAIMRVRRTKHLTQKELAEAILEPELSVKMIEQGILGENSDVLLAKIENYFGIWLRKKDRFEIPEKKVEEIDFNKGISEDLSVSDLREMQKEKEKAGKEGFWKSWMKKKDTEDSDEVESVDEAGFEPYEESKESQLSDEELDDILFGKK